MSVLYVSPAGQDTHEGTAKFPFKTITQALKHARPGSVVQLSSGTYQAGEQFPLVVPDGVSVVGVQSKSITVQGGGPFTPPAQANVKPFKTPINVTFVLGDRAQVRGLTVTNPQGSGLFSQNGVALVVNARFFRCQQHGVWVSAMAHPFLSKNEFSENEATGILMSAQAKGELRQNRFERNGYGILLTDFAAPLLMNNQLVGDRCAVVATDNARPVLRQTRATASQETALWVQDRAQLDIGHPQDLGNNQLEGNTYDLRNDAPTPVLTAGNRLNPIRVRGAVSYLPSDIPDEVAVPEVLLGNVDPEPFVDSSPEESLRPGATPSLDSRFNDLVGHWSAPFVEALAEKDLIKGFIDGTFRPDDQVTRAQFAALVAAAFPAAESIREMGRFADVPAGFWAARAIRFAQSRGFITGFPDGSFRPNAPLTRVQAAVALVNGLGLGHGRSESLLVYGDRAQIPSYAIEPVAIATERQMVVGYPDPYSFRPLVPITRAETTAFVHQALVAAGKTAPIASPFIPKPETAAPNFTDLSAQHWAHDFVEPLVKRGWLSGFRDGSFRPDAPMTRAQFAALLVGAFNPQPTRPAISFRDVPDDFWAATVIQRAYRARFISGFPDLRFDPNFPLTKLQALLSLVSGLALRTVSPPEERSLDVYSDKSLVPGYAVSVIATATQLGLVFNHPDLDQLRPNRTASRAEVSAMVYQALVLAGEMPAVLSNYQVVLD